MTRSLNRLKFQALEERTVPSWAGVPPLTIAPPTVAAKVGVTSFKNEASGNATISSKNEVDFFTFTAPTSGNYTFAATTPLSSMDTVLGVFNGNGDRIAFNNDITAGNTDSSVNVGIAAGSKIYLGITNHIDTPGGKYHWQVTTPGVDDKYDENDSTAKAKNLGKIVTSKSISGLKLLDQADWYKFSFKGLANTGASVSIAFQNAQGDLDLRLYDRNGNLVRISDGVTNTETVDLAGFVGGTFFIDVYGYQGAISPSYNLSINIPATPINSGSRTLYVNFDGYNMSRSTLERIGGGWGDPSFVDFFDGEGNGIQISPFLSSRGDREQIIRLMLYHAQQDLAQFGVTVRRTHGGAVENQTATTIFVGPSTLTNGYHIACDIDQGNNNPTDIAFVGDEDWGSVEDTGLALADVLIHEAGHTWGLWHKASGSNLETMGLRYNTPQSSWVANTTYQDVLYAQFSNHGPGPQNSYQTMRDNFGQAPTAPAARATVDFSVDGILAITTGGAADRVSVQQIESDIIEVRINGRVYRVNGLNEIRVFAEGDQHDQVALLNDIGDVTVTVDRSSRTATSAAVKLEAEMVHYWQTGEVAADFDSLPAYLGGWR